VFSRLIMAFLVSFVIALGALLVGGLLHAWPEGKRIPIGYAAPPIKEGRALSGHFDSALPTQLIDTTDGSIVSEYPASFLSRFSSGNAPMIRNAHRFFLTTEATTETEAAVFLIDSTTGSILESYQVPDGFNFATAILSQGKFHQRAVIILGLDPGFCDFALTIPCQATLINSNNGEILQTFEASGGEFDCTGERLRLNRLTRDLGQNAGHFAGAVVNAQAVQQVHVPETTVRALIDATTGEFIVPFGEHRFDFLC